MPASDAYYDSLFGSAAGAVPAGVSTPSPADPIGLGRIKGKLKGLNLKSAGAQIFGLMVIDRLLRAKHESGMRGIESERMSRQAGMATPENLIQQAAYPQAQQEEEMARTALLTAISGGIIGPSLARGERRIGG